MREIKGIEDYEIFSILRPTNTLRKVSTIRKALKLFKKKKPLYTFKAIKKRKQQPTKIQ